MAAMTRAAPLSMNLKRRCMRNFIRSYPTETRLFVVLAVICLFLSLASDSFFTLGNFASLFNNNAVNVIWAVGLLVVLIAGGIDISFAVAASVVQYVCVYVFEAIGGGNWVLGFLIAGGLGSGLGFINAALIYRFRIISIVVTIATFNAFFGLLMFFTSGRFLYDLPNWWTDRNSPASSMRTTVPMRVSGAKRRRGCGNSRKMPRRARSCRSLRRAPESSLSARLKPRRFSGPTFVASSFRRVPIPSWWRAARQAVASVPASWMR